DKLKIVYSKLTEKIKESIENRAQLICEQIQNEINVALSDEAERLQSFEDEFFASVSRIQEMFSVPQKHSRNGGVVDQIIGVAIGGVGTGGLFIGLREAGIKGALLGGASGFVGFCATFYAAAYLAGFLGIAAAGPVTLCLMAVAGLAGTFTGKFSVDKLLVQERIDKYKSNFKQSVKKQFHEMKINSDFTETVRQQVFASFQGLKSKIEEETEIILLDTQKTLDSLNQLKAEKKSMSDNEKEKLQTIAEYTGALLAETYNLHKALTDNME
ncbi:MAG: dynamin, partial [Oscillospiraceae bacterium]